MKYQNNTPRTATSSPCCYCSYSAASHRHTTTMSQGEVLVYISSKSSSPPPADDDSDANVNNNEHLLSSSNSQSAPSSEVHDSHSSDETSSSSSSTAKSSSTTLRIQNSISSLLPFSLPSSSSDSASWNLSLYNLTSHYLQLDQVRIPYEAIQDVSTQRGARMKQFVRIKVKDTNWVHVRSSNASRRISSHRDSTAAALDSLVEKQHISAQTVYMRKFQRIRQRNFVTLLNYLRLIPARDVTVDATLSDPDRILEEETSDSSELAPRTNTGNDDLSDILSDAHEMRSKNQEILLSLHRHQSLLQKSSHDMQYMGYLLNISDRLLRSLNSVRGTMWNVLSLWNPLTGAALQDPDESSLEDATEEERKQKKQEREQLKMLLEKQRPIVYVKNAQEESKDQAYLLCMLIFFEDALRILDENQSVVEEIPYTNIWKMEENDVEGIITHETKGDEKDLVFYSRFNDEIASRLRRCCRKSRRDNAVHDSSLRKQKHVREFRHQVLPGALAERRRRKTLQELLARQSRNKDHSADGDSSDALSLMRSLQEKKKQESLQELSALLDDVKSMQLVAGDYLDESSQSLDQLTDTVNNEKQRMDKSNEVIKKKTDQIKKNWIIF